MGYAKYNITSDIIEQALRSRGQILKHTVTEDHATYTIQFNKAIDLRGKRGQSMFFNTKGSGIITNTEPFHVKVERDESSKYLIDGNKWTLNFYLHFDVMCICCGGSNFLCYSCKKHAEDGQYHIIERFNKLSAEKQQSLVVEQADKFLSKLMHDGLYVDGRIEYAENKEK